jgi:RimJ/RimL family protein N-acetyltransferase
VLSFRTPNIDDLELYFAWANDKDVRAQSYNTSIICFEEHKNWFESVLNNDQFMLFVFLNSDCEEVGQVRIQKQSDNQAIIGISLDSRHRGKGYAKEMILISSDIFLQSNRNFLLSAYVKVGNLNSKFSFEKAGFLCLDKIMYKAIKSFHLIKKLDYENR